MRTAIGHILTHLRPRDAEELSECGLTCEDALMGLTNATVLRELFYVEDVPTAVIAFHGLTPRALAVSMLATSEFPRAARAVLRWAKATAKPQLLALGFARAECRTMAGHDEALRFLEHLGFRRECCVPGYGAGGRDFYQYAWSLDQHVPVQIPQTAAAATSTAFAR